VKDNKLIIASTSKILNVVDSNLLANDTALVIGKDDKSISIIDNGEIISLLNLPTMLMSDDGYLKLPTQQGVFIVQWGTVSVDADSVITGLFPIPFTTTPKVMIASHKNNDHPVSVSANALNSTTYEITITGGLNKENVSYIVIGN